MRLVWAPSWNLAYITASVTPSSLTLTERVGELSCPFGGGPLGEREDRAQGESRSRRDTTVTSRVMAAVRNRNSAAELAIRRRLWLNGVRYRVRSKLPGKPDIVFPRQRIVVFVDGDLWHGNSWRVRGLPSLESQFPTNTAWWVTKIRRNMARDAEVNEQLCATGWTVLRYWESEVLADPNRVAMDVAARALADRQTQFRPYELNSVERRRLGSVRPKTRVSGRPGESSRGSPPVRRVSLSDTAGGVPR